MSGCQTCGGYGQRHDPIAHGVEPEWVTCPTCNGERTVLRGQFDEVCPTCNGDGGWEP